MIPRPESTLEYVMKKGEVESVLVLAPVWGELSHREWELARRAWLLGLEAGKRASAAADEPMCCPRCGNETTEADLTYSGCGVCRAEAAAADLVDAAADEPGEQPKRVRSVFESLPCVPDSAVEPGDFV